MPSKTNGLKQHLASTQKIVKEQQQKEKEKAERDKAKDAAPSSSFDSPSKRKAPKSREASPAKVSKEKPQAETADDQQGSSSQPMETQGSSVNLGQIDDDRIQDRICRITVRW
jgi:hypothetical protein